MKIFIIPAWYPSNESDLNGIFVRQQAHALADRGHDVTVIHIEPISFTRLCRQKKHEVRLWQDGNVRTFFHKVVVPIPGKLADWQDNYLSNLYCRIIREHIEEDKKNGLPDPDVLHAHVSHSCAYYCLYAKEKLNIPLVVTEHYSGLLLGTATEREYDRVRETINGADAFIFVGSNFQKALCNKLGIHKETYVIPNMIDTSAFEIKNAENKCFTFLIACHLKKHKSVELVVTAFHQAFDFSCPVKLIIAGDGDDRKNLESLITQYNEGNRISLFGRYSSEQAKELFSNSDAFVLTSKVEPFGIVYIEALASGLPCIGTKGQGADDIIDDDNGYLVEYGKIDELAQKMKELYFNKSRYTPANIRQKCIDLFSSDSVCRRIEEIYLSVNTR